MSDVVRESNLNFDKVNDIKRQLILEIESILDKLFIMHRTFGRAKSQNWQSKT